MAAVEEFCVYAHKDAPLRNQLHGHFELARRQGLLIHHSDRDIDAGTPWRGVVDEYLESADIILLLISRHFFESDHAYDTEMKRALERHQNGEATVIPVILRLCVWTNAPFAALQALPPGGKPITTFSDREKGFSQVVEAVEKIARDIQTRKTEGSRKA
jgi:hypothetical protein